MEKEENNNKQPSRHTTLNQCWINAESVLIQRFVFSEKQFTKGDNYLPLVIYFLKR